MLPPAAPIEEREEVGRKANAAKPGKRRTIKCSEATYQAVRRVAYLREMDMADYVDHVLLPIATKDLQASIRKTFGSDG